ncbi:hypothetical protein EK21DRAFT_63466 [Setomelanomma holmii]|uniref:Uncharacterized protein n=1 Tax=Setomelanomma holmii TaxID=210430 RepID=A0A9P4LNJ9_9PLEO|nr:hypothetical protein EK21DRAFT_63466 [Setomelanomma holmii]
MTANAPYFQMRSGQFITAPNSTNGVPSSFAAEDEDGAYDLSAAARASPHEHHPSLYSAHPVHHLPSGTALNPMDENHNLADLLEAATTAADQAAQALDIPEAAPAGPAVQAHSKRKRVTSPTSDKAVATPCARPIIASKRRRVDVPTDPELQKFDHAVHGSTLVNSTPRQGESLLSDARAAGVHSAAALFRRTSERSSRKYTRPPMSKLFMSLQLSPENFLQLQAQAKTYMLDTNYPERQNCVGNRGKGDTDMVKLRLFNCVRDFLNAGIGEQFFGANVEKPGEREAVEAARSLGEDQMPNTEERLTWPRDGNKIISLVTPLMRRMVTNERQRMYAIETRKGGSKKQDKEGSVEGTFEQMPQSPADINIFLLTPDWLLNETMKSSPKLDEKRIAAAEAPTALTLYAWERVMADITALLSRAVARYPVLNPAGQHASEGIPDQLTDTLQELAAAANAMQNDNITDVGQRSSRLPIYNIKTVGPTGWEVIQNAEQWSDLLQRRSQEVWADGIVNIVVELTEGPVTASVQITGN